MKNWSIQGPGSLKSDEKSRMLFYFSVQFLTGKAGEFHCIGEGEAGLTCASQRQRVQCGNGAWRVAGMAPGRQRPCRAGGSRSGCELTGGVHGHGRIPGVSTTPIVPSDDDVALSPSDPRDSDKPLPCPHPERACQGHVLEGKSATACWQIPDRGGGSFDGQSGPKSPGPGRHGQASPEQRLLAIVLVEPARQSRSTPRNLPLSRRQQRSLRAGGRFLIGSPDEV
jgi:hypothetical protein